jgi:hypothetical protein
MGYRRCGIGRTTLWLLWASFKLADHLDSTQKPSGKHISRLEAHFSKMPCASILLRTTCSDGIPFEHPALLSVSLPGGVEGDKGSQVTSNSE